MFDEKTKNMNLPLPHAGNFLDEDLPRLRESFGKLDEEAAGLAQKINDGLKALNGDLSEFKREIDKLKDDLSGEDIVPNDQKSFYLKKETPSGSVIDLPVAYFPTLNDLFLYYGGLICTPRDKAGEADDYQYEEIGGDPTVPSRQVRILFPASPAIMFDARVISSASGYKLGAGALEAMLGETTAEAEAARKSAKEAVDSAAKAAQSRGKAETLASGAAESARRATEWGEAAKVHADNTNLLAIEAAKAAGVADRSAFESVEAAGLAGQYKDEAAGSAAAAESSAAEAARQAGAGAQSASDSARSANESAEAAGRAELSAQAALDAESHAALLEASAKQAADAANQDSTASGLSAQAAADSEAAAKLAAQGAQGALEGVRQSAQEAQGAASEANESKNTVAGWLADGLDASLLVSGTIDPARLPNTALTHVRDVQDDEERFGLTIDRVQQDDMVYVIDTEKLYQVMDVTKLDSEEGYRPFSAPVLWASIQGKPTAFVPTSHAASHGAGGSDPITPQSIGALPVGGKAASAGAADKVPWSGVVNPPTEYNPTPITLADSVGDSNLPAIASGSIQAKIQALRNNVKYLLASVANAVGLGGTPSTQAFGDAASEGSGLTAARYDHKHKMPAAPTSVSGNAGTATKLATARNIVGNDNSATSSANFDGSGNITVGLPVIVTAGTAASTLPTSAATYSLRAWLTVARNCLAWLVARFNSSGQALSAVQLATARTISLSGDVTGSTTFNGAANVSITASIANSAVQHSKLTVAVAALANVTVPSYVVGSGKLKVYVFGLYCRAGANNTFQYREVGSVGAASTTIQFYDTLAIGAEITAISNP